MAHVNRRPPKHFGTSSTLVRFRHIGETTGDYRREEATGDYRTSDSVPHRTTHMMTH